MRIGGSAAYGALLAARFGLRVSMLTSARSDLDLAVLAGVDITLIPTRQNTVMEHRFEDGRRIQFLRSAAGRIETKDVPTEMSDARLLLVAPVAEEVDARVVSAFPDATAVAAAQGWLRGVDADGRVVEGRVERMEAEALRGASAVVLSEEDLGGRQIPNAWLHVFQVLIVTRSRRGLRVFQGGRWLELDSFPAIEREPTGAGDVLATAYLIRFSETGDVSESIRFAAAAASLAVEAPGLEGVPWRPAVEQRLWEHPEIQLRPSL
jgi:sugar/nucleoside kinase (ribokinase family)